MMSFTIPKQYQEGLAQLLTLSGEEIESLRQALKDVPGALKATTLKSKLASESSIPLEKIDEIINTLLSLYSLRSYLDLSIPEFLEQLTQAMEQSGNDKLQLPSQNHDLFKAHLMSLLDSRALTITAKAPEVWFDHKYAFCSARIFSDIRPVFSMQAEVLPLAAGIVHTLKITYHTGDKTDDFYIAMDAGDIKTLREVLDRADLKFGNLKSILEAAKVPFLDSE